MPPNSNCYSLPITAYNNDSKPGSLSPKNGRRWGGFLAVFNEQEGVASLLVDHRVVDRGAVHKLQQRKLQLQTGEKAFDVSGVKDWSGLPRETLGSPPLEIFKAQLNVVLSHLRLLTLL